jgi:hypothetical protein
MPHGFVTPVILFRKAPKSIKKKRNSPNPRGQICIQSLGANSHKKGNGSDGVIDTEYATT